MLMNHPSHVFLGLAWSRYVRYCDKETLNSNKQQHHPSHVHF